ncbi:MAG: hypothetical protein ACR2L3_01480 [Actinomycetota bacterium]
MGWLCRKAVAYLERRGGTSIHDLLDLALARAGDDEKASPAEQMNDPFVVDVALHELGWFDLFLAERGPLLPEDEQLLAASWALVDRSVYEILGVDPGVGVEVQDLRTAERLEVRERTFSRRAQPGLLVCARVVPDGAGHQFIGGIFTVAPGTEAHLLDLLDQGDGYELCGYFGDLERPPTVVTTEGEPLVACTAILELPDVNEAVVVLDRLYRREEAGKWVEMHISERGDGVLRATLQLDAARLRVETMSERRLERIVSVLQEEIVGAGVLFDERRPVEPGRRSAGSPPTPILPAVDPEVEAALGGWLEIMEERWCDEEVPALGHLTPRQAADDPTRREVLERLLTSFEDMNAGLVPSGAVGFRPERLRHLLGLDTS